MSATILARKAGVSLPIRARALPKVNPKHLAELRQFLDRVAPGVVVRFTSDRSRSNCVYVALIEVPASQRGHGLGARALNVLCQTADARGWALRGSPSGDFGSNLDRLISWYEGAGFVVDSEIPGVTRTMMRTPRSIS